MKNQREMCLLGQSHKTQEPIMVFVRGDFIMPNKNQSNDIFTEYPDVITVAQLQQMLRTSRRTAYDLVKTGEIPSVMIGGSFKILKRNVISYLEKPNFLS